MIANPVSLPNQPVIEQFCQVVASKTLSFGSSRLEFSDGAFRVVSTEDFQDALTDGRSENHTQESKASDQKTQNNTSKKDQSAQPTNQPTNQPANQDDRRSFWARMFKLPPMRARVEKALTQDWKFAEVRQHDIETLLSDDEEESRRFFLDGVNARQYHRLVKEFGIGYENRNGKIVDESFDSLSEYGPELIKNYSILMENRELIKRYFAGVFRDGRISTQSLIRISNSMWFGTFEAPKFKLFANLLHNRFQVPNHVIGPMLASVGDSIWLRQVLSRKSTPQEFQQLLNKIAPPSTEGSGNAFAPALQLLVLGEENKIPFNALYNFVDQLKLNPKDFGPFSAVIYNLAPYRLAGDIRCPTFAQFLRRMFDEFGADINQESARLFVLSFREYKDDAESLGSLLSPKYADTKAFLKGLGIAIPSTVWNMERIAVLTQTLTPEKKAKITRMVRSLSEEVKVADIMFLAEICDSEEETKLLLDRNALVAAVKDVKIDRIVERSNNDLVKELEREIDNANRNGLFRTVRRLRNMINEEKKAYTERVDPSKLTNIQLSRLLIFHRSLEVPGFLDTVGWNVSLDLQNERSEGGGYLGYDKDMAMVTMVAGQPGDNRQYRPQNLFRAPASLALFHNHAFNDTFAQRYLGFMKFLFPSNKNKNTYAGPSGWVGAKKGDISAAAESELPSFIITKIGHGQKPDGTKDTKSLLVNFDWVVVDPQSGQALRSDRGVFNVPFYGQDQLGKLKWPSRKEQRRQEREKRERCPLPAKQTAEVR